MAEERKVNVPEAPGLLPAALQKKWTKDYESAYREASNDNSLDEPSRVQAAYREANRAMRVAKPESYEEARALADWQVVDRAEANGELRGVTIDGKKFRFAIPTAPARPAKGKE